MYRAANTGTFIPRTECCSTLRQETRLDQGASTPGRASSVSVELLSGSDCADVGSVNEGGFFAYDGLPHYWLACLRLLPGGVPGTGRTWRLYAPIFGNLEKDCEQVKLVATPVDRKAGAYQYQ
jgi:hypothetical protein